MRKTDKPYRFRDRSGAGRNIEVMFRHIPGRWISTGTKDMVDAIKFAERVMATDGIDQERVPSLKEFADGYYLRTGCGSLQARHATLEKTKRPGWYRENQHRLDNFILPRFGSYLIDSITPVAIENWLTDLRGMKGAPLSSRTRKKILESLRVIMDDAVRQGLVADNPARKAEAPADKSTRPRRALTLWEESVLFPQDPDARLAVWGTLTWTTYFSVMYDTGFRPGEVAGLMYGDVYRARDGLAVFTTHSINSEEFRPQERVKTTGEGMSSRVGLLSAVTADLLQRLVEEQGITGPDEYLFLKHRKKRISYIYIRNSCEKFAKVISEQGLDEDLVQYCIRHTYVTYRRGGVDERVLALSTGHSNGVRNVYDHRDAAILINQLESQRDALTRPQAVPDIVPITKKR